MAHNWDATHYDSINCKVRTWRREKALQGWKHAKLSMREQFDALRIPYEISPWDAKHGLVLYVNAEVHKILSESKIRIHSFAGPVFVKRPYRLVERWLREYADRCR